MKSKIFAVAKREFLENVRSKAFLISLVLTPAIMIGFGLLPSFFVSKAETNTIILGIVDETNWLTEKLSERLNEKYKLPSEQPNYFLRIFRNGDFQTLLNNADALALKEEIEGVFIFPNTIESDSTIEYRSIHPGNIHLVNRFEKTIQEILREERMRRANVSDEEIKKFSQTLEINPIKISTEGEEKKIDFKTQFFSSYIFVMLMLMLILTSGQMLVRSVVEEKSNRIVEILLSSCSASDLMNGKILGLSGLGITQIFLWVLIGISAVPSFAVLLFSTNGIWFLPMYFILGYLMYAAIFVGIGSLVNTEQEAQQITTYVSLILVFPIVLSINAFENPNDSLFQILSFFPLMTPTMIALRISVQMPSTFEIIATLLLLFATMVTLMWTAGKIFRIGILSTGKRMTMKELWEYLKTH
ncbi:MAG: ABC transporter permease [Ignavibacteria bacterium]|nr:ABC transporter permease [Ignavibacteria bacterium]